MPSAFLTTSAGNLSGEDGPIAVGRADLAHARDGEVHHHAERELEQRRPLQRQRLGGVVAARAGPEAVLSDGYRDIKTLSVAKNGDAVTAVFATPYADWNLLFRDVEALGTQGGCAIASLLTRPSLGPYSVTSATTIASCSP